MDSYRIVKEFRLVSTDKAYTKYEESDISFKIQEERWWGWRDIKNSESVDPPTTRYFKTHDEAYKFMLGTKTGGSWTQIGHIFTFTEYQMYM